MKKSILIFIFLFLACYAFFSLNQPNPAAVLFPWTAETDTTEASQEVLPEQDQSEVINQSESGTAENDEVPAEVVEKTASESSEESSAGTEEVLPVSYTPENTAAVSQKPNHLEVYGGAGYFVPMGRYWDLMTGAVNVEAGLQFDFIPYLLNRDKVKVLFKPGFNMSYSFAVHKPGVTDFYSNMLLFTLPAEFSFLLVNKHTIFAGTGAGLAVDIYSIKRDDSYSPYSELRFAFFVNAGYEYFFGKKAVVGIGFNNIFSFSVEKSFFASYKLQCYAAYKIEIKNKHKKTSGLLDG